MNMSMSMNMNMLGAHALHARSMGVLCLWSRHAQACRCLLVTQAVIVPVCMRVARQRGWQIQTQRSGVQTMSSRAISISSAWLLN